MKGLREQFLRLVLAPVVGVALAGIVSVGCGASKAANPDAVTVNELKYPGDLQIWDKGNGTVSLQWSAANNEKDFDGFNVYGMHSTAGDGTDLGLAKTLDAVQFLDADGNPTTAKDTVLAKFDYDATAKKIEAAGTPPATSASATDKPELSARPIQAKATDAAKPFLPTCKVGTGNACVLTTAADQGKTVGDTAALAANGTITFDLTQTDKLVVGETYCFLVLSSMKEGSVISQTSSNAACITPKYSSTFQVALPATVAAGTTPTYDDALKFDVNTWVTACNAAATGCTDPTTATATLTTDAKAHVFSDPDPVYFEGGSSGAGMVAGAGAGIADLGYYQTGFADPTLPKAAPAFILDTKTIAAGTAAGAPVFNQGGYSLGGQTVPVAARHMYVVAVPSDTTNKAYRYLWLYFSDATITAGSAASVEARISHDAK